MPPAGDSDLRLPEGVAPVLGDYRLVRFLDESPHMLMYHAVQQSVDRNVVLQLLKPEACTDEGLRDEFKKLARAKAKLVHPNIAPVYELLQSGPTLFYTGELLSGRNLDQLSTGGQDLSTEQVLQIMVTVGEAMTAIKSQELSHRPLKGTDIHLDQQDQAHLANLALPAGAPNASKNEGVGIRKFISSLERVSPMGIAADLIQTLKKLSHDRILTWEGLLRESRLSRRRYNIGRANHVVGARGFATSWLRKKDRKRRIAVLSLICGALLALLSVVLLARPVAAPQSQIPDTMLCVSGGTFSADGAESEHLPTFWISQHEVTIAQYAKFLEDLATRDGTGREFDHEEQPATKRGHAPADWETIYAQARQGGTYSGHEINLDCPMTMIDWWDAYTYAKWAGQRLPSTLEWRKAASGPDGTRYPWGDSPPTDQANFGADYSPGAEGGQIDGFNYWAPVDAHQEDLSPFGAIGMAGNVEEWTATWATHPDYPDRRTPVVNGGSFASSIEHHLGLSRRAESPEESSLARGFRTASSSPPSDER